jgi:hypothetical protein
VPPVGFEERERLDLSHFGESRSLMSHDNYRAHFFFSPLTLATLQDMGLPVDRKGFCGYAIYGDSRTHELNSSHNFCSRDPSGLSFNTNPFTLGLFVYGSSNIISMDGTQILQSGERSTGICIEGCNNIMYCFNTYRAFYFTGFLACNVIAYK